MQHNPDDLNSVDCEKQLRIQQVILHWEINMQDMCHFTRMVVNLKDYRKQHWDSEKHKWFKFYIDGIKHRAIVKGGGGEGGCRQTYSYGFLDCKYIVFLSTEDLPSCSLSVVFTL